MEDQRIKQQQQKIYIFHGISSNRGWQVVALSLEEGELALLQDSVMSFCAPFLCVWSEDQLIFYCINYNWVVIIVVLEFYYLDHDLSANIILSQSSVGIVFFIKLILFF